MSMTKFSVCPSFNSLRKNNVNVICCASSLCDALKTILNIHLCFKQKKRCITNVGLLHPFHSFQHIYMGVLTALENFQRLIIVPPELAYGKKGVQEIPPNATIEVN